MYHHSLLTRPGKAGRWFDQPLNSLGRIFFGDAMSVKPYGVCLTPVFDYWWYSMHIKHSAKICPLYIKCMAIDLLENTASV